jgi:hypothetical protein
MEDKFNELVETLSNIIIDCRGKQSTYIWNEAERFLETLLQDEKLVMDLVKYGKECE